MAELKSKFLGKLKGSLGDLTGRIRNGKGYLASKPSSFNAPTDAASLNRRAKFKLAVKFSYAALRNAGIKIIWKKTASGNSSPFANIMRENYKFIHDGTLNVYNIITPRSGFNPVFTSAVLSNTELSVDLSALNGVTDFDTGVETELKVAAVIFLAAPNNPGFDQYNFISLESNPVALQLDNPQSFTIPIVNFESSMIDIYQNKKIFLAVFSLDGDGIPVHYSSTFVQ